MMTREELKERQSIVGIINYEDIYSITKDGTVYRTRTKHKDIFRKIQTKMKPNGYLYCTLSRSGLHKNFYIHRLVAQAFIPNRENKPHIDHINGDKKDNRVENLRWVTHKENMNNPVSTAKLSSARKKYYLNEDNLRRNRQQKHNKAIVQLSIEGEVVGEYQSIRDAQRQTGIGASSIFNCIKQYTHTAGGFKWQYKE